MPRSGSRIGGGELKNPAESFGQNRSVITPCGMYMKPSRTGGFDAAGDFRPSAQPIVSSSGNPSDTPSPVRQVRRLIRTLLRIWGLSCIGHATMSKGLAGYHAK